MVTRQQQPPVRLFTLYGLEDLAALTGYSPVTLLSMKLYPNRITPAFRDKVSRILRLSEAELFTSEAYADSVETPVEKTA